jgi:hypothetical protein
VESTGCVGRSERCWRAVDHSWLRFCVEKCGGAPRRCVRWDTDGGLIAVYVREKMRCLPFKKEGSTSFMREKRSYSAETVLYSRALGTLSLLRILTFNSHAATQPSGQWPSTACGHAHGVACVRHHAVSVQKAATAA